MDPITAAVLSSIASTGLKAVFGGMQSQPSQVTMGQHPNMGNANPFGDPLSGTGGIPGVSSVNESQVIQPKPQQAQNQNLIGGLLSSLVTNVATKGSLDSLKDLFGSTPNYIGADPSNWTQSIGAWKAPDLAESALSWGGTEGSDLLGSLFSSFSF